MDQEPTSSTANDSVRTACVLGAMVVMFLGLAAVFLADLWGHPPARPQIGLVDPSFLETTPWRQTYADLQRAKKDLSDFDCYACHDRKKSPVLTLDENNVLIIPEEHESIVMGHGSHNRNNLCYNCHNEANLLTFSIRDGQELPFAGSSQLCGSCHGPTIRDWEVGAHGRISGHWHRPSGEMHRLDCVSCHDPHSPGIPSRPPAPPPHLLRDPVGPTAPATAATTH